MQEPGSGITPGGSERPSDPAGDEGARALQRTGRQVLLAEELRALQPPDAGDTLDLQAYWHLLRKHRWMIAGVVGVVIAAVLVLTLLTVPTYRATTLIQIDREALKVVEFDGDQRPVEAGASNDFYQTQYELLKSRALAERVANDLRAPEAASQRAMFATGPLDRLTGAGPQSQGEAGTGNVAKDSASRAFVGAVLGAVTVEPIRNSRLVKVHFDSADAAFSARAVNAYADGFIASTLERRFDASSYARTFLEERLEQLKQRLEDSERQLVGFAQQEQIVTADDGQSMSTQNLSELNSALAEAQAQRIRAEARWRQASATRGAGLPADTLANSILRPLQERRAELMADYQEQLQIYKPGFPAMQQLKGQIDEVDRQIVQELVSIRASVKAEYDAALSQERLLVGKMGGVRNEVLDLQNRSIRYNILKREVDTNRQLYDALLQRYKEVGVAGGVSTNNVSIVDRAQAPLNRFKPSLSRNLALGLLFSLLAGVIGALLIERFDDTIRSPDEVESLLNLPVLGSIPLLKDKQPMQASTDVRSAFAESYRSVRTALQFSTDSGVPKTLLVTSAGPGEGKSTTALVLARNFAQLGLRVLLVDADLRNPTLHRTNDVDNSNGLSNFLAGATPAIDAIQPGGTENMWIIPSGPLPPNPAELLAGSRMQQLLSLAADRYDQVIIDGPPIIGLADAPMLSHIADGTLLMVAAGKSRRGSLRAAVKRLSAARARVVGTVVTMYDARQAGYGHDEYAYYSYGATPPGKLLGRG